MADISYSSIAMNRDRVKGQSRRFCTMADDTSSPLTKKATEAGLL